MSSATDLESNYVVTSFSYGAPFEGVEPMIEGCSGRIVKRICAAICEFYCKQNFVDFHILCAIFPTSSVCHRRIIGNILVIAKYCTTNKCTEKAIIVI